MWTLKREAVEGGFRLGISQGDVRLSFDAMLDLLTSSDDFANWYTDCLADEKMEAYFWEHPPLTKRNIGSEAEFVLIESEALAALRPDSSPFRPQLKEQPDGDVISFLNLGGDAFLVVPRKRGPSKAYTHLAAFVRLAPREQVIALWRETARLLRERLSAAAPLWLSTAGVGVPWLHIRIDGEPKYYHFEPYRSPDLARYQGG